jgi:dihydropyrimidinase
MTNDAAVHDLVISGGIVVSATGEAALDVAIDGEQITGLYEPGTAGEAKRTIDARGCLVTPGGIDPHVHYAMNFQDLLVTEGPEYSFDAVLGGTTTVIDFAIQEAPGTPLDAIAKKRAEHDGVGMATDYGLHVIFTRDFSYEDIEQVSDIIKGGIPTIKTMMTYGWMSDDGRRYGLMCEVAEHGGMSVVHAEDDDIANWLTAKYIREGKTHGAHICEVRGPLVEEAATRRALFLAERAGCSLYVLHMAAGSAVEALAEWRARGLPMYGETLTTYLSFTQDDLWDESPVQVGDKTYNARGLLFNNYPTPKFGPDRETCWEAITDDRLQVVGTDHAVVKLTDRFGVMSTTIDNMQAGQAVAELRVPLLYSEGVVKGRFSASRWVELMATNPARLMGLHPRKGELAAGADADVLVFDPNKQWTVRWQDLHMSEAYNCWDGWEVTGKVRDVVRRGEILVENEDYVGSKTSGKFIERAIDPEVVNGPLDLDFTRTSLTGAAVPSTS